MKDRIRVLVVDDSPLFREVAAKLMSHDERIEIVATAGDPYEARDKLLEYKPEVMAVEELFWNTNQKTGITVAEARGTILLAAHKRGLKIFEYTPLQVKQAVVGYGRAEKNQVIAMVTSILKLQKPPKPDDTADALAIAICHGHAGESPLGKFYKM